MTELDKDALEKAARDIARSAIRRICPPADDSIAMRAHEDDIASSIVRLFADATRASPPVPGDVEQPLWLVYSREHNAFWRPNCAGYTRLVEDAGRYTKEEADDHCRSRDFADQTNPPEVAVMAPEAADLITRLARERDTAIKHLSEAAYARGEAEGRLAASEMAGVVDGWRERAEALEADNERLREAVSDPAAVHINMLRGSIAMPSVTNIIHLYGEEKLRAALNPEGESQ